MGNPSEETCCRPNQKLQITDNKLRCRTAMSIVKINFFNKIFLRPLFARFPALTLCFLTLGSTPTAQP